MGHKATKYMYAGKRKYNATLPMGNFKGKHSLWINVLKIHIMELS